MVVSLVTGASGGIGFAVARRVLYSGHRVAVFTRHPHTAESARERLLQSLTTSSTPQHASLSLADVKSRVVTQSFDFAACDADAFKQSILAIQTQFGVPQIDNLVCAHGISHDALLVRQKDEDIERTLRVNLSSTITIAREVSKIMIKQSGGCIVNIGSVIGSHGSVGQSIYAASKAGLVGFSKSLAKELAPKQIRVNVVAPGFIDTPMTQGLSEARRQQLLSQIPLQRFGQADEVAELVEYLLNARYVTGQEMTIDGGLCV